MLPGVCSWGAGIRTPILRTKTGCPAIGRPPNGGYILGRGRHGTGTRAAAHAARLSTGQNIRWGTGAETTPASMVRAWMASPAHRALILSGAFHDVGVAISTRLPAMLAQGPGGALYAVEFAARAG